MMPRYLRVFVPGREDMGHAVLNDIPMKLQLTSLHGLDASHRMTESVERWAGLTVVEGIEGTWHYHLLIAGQHDALCGNGAVISTSLPVESWGVRTHLNERYCVVCEERNPND